ncbi:hypothetical protein L332_03440 [Agrococcus pavilionensis RW1]|uniref:Uncharacterized protein n=1 Tax=Agrococcus pavilionensis RW1 TaxID=1330458 RepID=U1LME6_9MICO|nr:hypothetical protein [Agrococcus pavilionensis]ERG63509.1 hypothetical protein L332_03440 [Agrococcus pavilionensis RW1]
MRATLEQLNAAAQRVREAVPMPNPLREDYFRLRDAAIDAELAALGIPAPVRPDNTGSMHGAHWAWHTGQLTTGLIVGRWGNHVEEVAIEIVVSHAGTSLAWIVEDADSDADDRGIYGHYAKKYRKRRNESMFAPVTDAPELPELPVPAEPTLFDWLEVSS